MNRRRFLTSVPVLAAYGFVVAMVGRLFGTHPKRQLYCTLAPCQPDKLGCTKVFEPYCSTRAKRMSAGRLRREPELMAGGDAELMASWEEGPVPTMTMYTTRPIAWDTKLVDGKKVRFPRLDDDGATYHS